ncbi:MAG: MFS transporter, partial [Firmicutes bacterium]|nr:MFS transporter [Bacillota bacterium]
MKLNYKRTILIGFAFMAISGFWQVYDNIIPLILKYNFGIGDTLSGGIMALDNVFALFMLPIFGAWSDKVSTSRGKRTPFIFVGTILAVVFMTLIPVAANMRSLGFFVIALLLT